jgi:membrane protein implicated in regulation of membrane protease activity
MRIERSPIPTPGFPAHSEGCLPGLILPVAGLATIATGGFWHWHLLPPSLCLLIMVLIAFMAVSVWTTVKIRTRRGSQAPASPFAALAVKEEGDDLTR